METNWLFRRCMHIFGDPGGARQLLVLKTGSVFKKMPLQMFWLNSRRLLRNNPGECNNPTIASDASLPEQGSAGFLWAGQRPSVGGAEGAH